MFGVLVHDGADKAVIAGLSGFTPKAIEFAQGKPLDLIDAKDIARICSSSSRVSSAAVDSTDHVRQGILAVIWPAWEFTKAGAFVLYWILKAIDSVVARIPLKR